MRSLAFARDDCGDEVRVFLEFVIISSFVLRHRLRRATQARSRL